MTDPILESGRYMTPLPVMESRYSSQILLGSARRSVLFSVVGPEQPGKQVCSDGLLFGFLGLMSVLLLWQVLLAGRPGR